MNDEPTGNVSVSEHGTDWDKLRHMSDADIRAGIDSDPDAKATDADFWTSAELVMPQRKSTVTLRLDGDVLAWLKRPGNGYQTRINAILRSYMDAHKSEASRHS